MIYVYYVVFIGVYAHMGRKRRMKGEETIKSEERGSESTEGSGLH